MVNAPNTQDTAISKPTVIRDGLAIYRVGVGRPVLLMPYPHGFPRQPMAEGPLAEALVRMGREVVSFDPPGAFRSTRPARVDMPEMLDCAEEALDTCEIDRPVDVVGHSMGGLCSLSLALERGRRVARLVLIGTPVGGMLTTLRARGIPFMWPPWDPRFWQVSWSGFCLMRGGGNMAMHKRLQRLFWYPSYVDKSLVPHVVIEDRDSQRPPPVRDRWPRAIRGLDYLKRLGEVCAPTLVCVGRFDPQAPVMCSEELAHGIPGARLVIFEHSAHYPFLEEPEQFAVELVAFYKKA